MENESCNWIIYDWMKPFIEDFGMDSEVVRILGREGISDEVLEALQNARKKGQLDVDG